MFYCEILKILAPVLNTINSNSNNVYADLFGDDIEKMSQSINNIEIAMRKREEFMEDIQR